MRINSTGTSACSVDLLSMLSDTFIVHCGIRQGGILSPILFSVYVDDLIGQLRASGYGIYIGSIFCGCILYADDIVLLSSSCYGLPKMLDVCEQYGSLWDIKFNPSKSYACAFGGSHPSNINVTLADRPVQWVNSCKIYRLYHDYVCPLRWKGQAEDNISAPSSFISNAQNELYA